MGTACYLVQSTYGDELSHITHENEEENDFTASGVSVVMSLLSLFYI